VVPARLIDGDKAIPRVAYRQDQAVLADGSRTRSLGVSAAPSDGAKPSAAASMSWRRACQRRRRLASGSQGNALAESKLGGSAGHGRSLRERGPFSDKLRAVKFVSRVRNEPGAGAIIPVPSRGRMWLTNGPPHGNWAEAFNSGTGVSALRSNDRVRARMCIRDRLALGNQCLLRAGSRSLRRTWHRPRDEREHFSGNVGIVSSDILWNSRLVGGAKRIRTFGPDKNGRSR